jgi:hypothetical protein
VITCVNSSSRLERPHTTRQTHKTRKTKPTKSSPSNGVAAQATALQQTTSIEKKNDETDCQVQHTRSVLRGCADAEADMPSAEASGARCVQNFDGSRNSAIHTTYRISLRSSSIREPRYPLLRVVIWFVRSQKRQSTQRRHHNHDQDASETQKHWYVGVCSSRCMQKQHRWCTQRRNHHHHNNTQSRKNKTTKTV